MADEVEQDDAGFAALMSAAAEDGAAGKDPAPYGYMTDPVTGEERPRKTRGRVPRSPSLDELKAGQEAAAAGAPEAPAAEDRAPQTGKRGRRGKGAPREPKPDQPVPQFREGQIAKGMNRLYRRAGKIVRAMDHDIGTAIIESTKKDDDEDVTVGEAWEELARTNPRIRQFLLKAIAGGAWGQLFMAHAPILMAVIMKDSVRKYVPFMKIIESMAEPEDGAPAGEGGLPGGMTAADVAEASRLAQEQMAKMGFKVSPDMAAAAERMFVPPDVPLDPPAEVPPAFRRQQPKNRSRAQRAGHR